MCFLEMASFKEMKTSCKSYSTAQKNPDNNWEQQETTFKTWATHHHHQELNKKRLDLTTKEYNI